MSDALAPLRPLATGLGLLIRLHDREADAELIRGLLDSDAAGLFAALIDGPAPAEFSRALAALPQPPGPEVLDLLAAEFADVYLTHGYRIAPTGSVWLTEEKLERQEPMFAVRDYYTHYGLSVPDWRLRSDDHMVHELQFIQHLLGLGSMSAARDAAHFMDLHVLNWLPQFCALMAQRCEQSLMIATARLTGAYLETLRAALTELTGVAPPPSEAETPAAPGYGLAELEQDVAYMPGLGESW